MPNDISPVAPNPLNRFGQFCAQNGYEVPDLKYTETQTTRTTVKFATDSIIEPLDRGFRDTAEWREAVEITWDQLRIHLCGDQLSSDGEIDAEIDWSKSPGYPFNRQGMFEKRQWRERMAPQGEIIAAARKELTRTMTNIVWCTSMKKELTPIVKLEKRKQRMFMIMPVHAVVLHKKYFSKQSKRLRCRQEIAHGTTFFFGGVHQLAQSLEGQTVQSEDDEFWDKRFLIMEDIYKLRLRALQMSGEEIILPEVECIIDSLRRPMLLLPDGNVIVPHDRLNPSGADATTENNCIGRKLYENYMRLLHAKSLDKPVPRAVLNATKFFGDDRIAGMGEHYPGYAKFYEENLIRTGVKIKSLVTTSGPIGAEFCGFKIGRAHWRDGFYAPLYSLDRLYAGLFIPSERDIDIGFSRLMAMSLLFFPHKEEFAKLQPIVMRYLQQFPREKLALVAFDFWSDPRFLAFMWDGLESGPFFARDEHFSAVQHVLAARSLAEEGYCFLDVLDFNESTSTC
jgi:hypothetical protein